MIQIDDLTDAQCRKLEELGFTVGLNAAVKSATGATLYIWYPNATKYNNSDNYAAEVVRTNNKKKENVDIFDDPISAAVFLLTCV